MVHHFILAINCLEPFAVLGSRRGGRAILVAVLQHKRPRQASLYVSRHATNCSVTVRTASSSCLACRHLYNAIVWPCRARDCGSSKAVGLSSFRLLCVVSLASRSLGTKRHPINHTHLTPELPQVLFTCDVIMELMPRRTLIISLSKTATGGLRYLRITSQYRLKSRKHTHHAWYQKNKKKSSPITSLAHAASSRRSLGLDVARATAVLTRGYGPVRDSGLDWRPTRFHAHSAHLACET